MLPHLSRVTLWLAALAAAASLFPPGRHGAMLASIAMVSLIGALVMRRFHLKTHVVATPDPDHTRPLDDMAMLDAAMVLSRAIHDAADLAHGLREVREALILELGAHDLTLHESERGEPLVVA